ncbi:polymer-forming cytoskeletal protein [Sphingobium sufflavum]|uniref:bactofilin family protein n=1 Tax=Sphingobium sufflavum TaxID=1129547 RepID=UPI001F2456B4|nr:polymer-forming cytoskeletal protein [Sphingobium sufflavum]MCE7795590.1 polymer-forming cytoskeletal protein [Sphingobium sufflavum]
MFSKPAKTASRPAVGPATGANRIPFSLIGADVTIQGDVAASVDLHVDGRVNGNIACAALVQGPESHIHGAITARSARIAGHVEGSIAADELIVEASARITGDIVYQSISIAPGAEVAGQFSHRGGEAHADLRLVSNEGATVGQS